MVITKNFVVFLGAAIVISTALFATSAQAPQVEHKPPSQQLEPLKKGQKFTAYIASDLHYLSPELHDDGEAYDIFANPRDGKEVRYIADVVDAFIEEVKHDKPEILILSGDLTTNGEEQSHRDLAAKLSAVLADTRVYVIPGNHDIYNAYARSFQGENQVRAPYISDTDFKEMYGDMGYNAAISHDRATLSYLAAPSEDLWLLMLDTCKYTSNVSKDRPQTDGGLGEETYKWIEECGVKAAEAGAALIAVQHHNMIDHNELISLGFTIEGNQRMVDAYHATNVNLVFSGHIHCQEISEHEGIYDIASGALAVYPQQYGQLTFDGKRAEYGTKSVDVNAYTKRKGLTDENLLNYAEYSKQHFISSRGATPEFSAERTNEEQSSMLSTLREMNARYFAGWPRDDLIGSPGYELLMKEEGFFVRYLESMSKDDGVPDTELEIYLK